MQANVVDPVATDPGRSHRLFGIRGAMTMIAATAGGLAWTRSYVRYYLLPFLSSRGALPQRYHLAWMLSVVPMLTAWSVGLLLCQMYRPRPPVRHLTTRPGTVACGVVSLTFAAGVLIASVVRVVSLIVPGWRGSYGPFQPFPVSYLIARYLPEAGLVLAGAWLLMAGARSFLPESTLEDRLGRGIGWTWIVIFLLHDLCFFSMSM